MIWSMNNTNYSIVYKHYNVSNEILSLFMVCRGKYIFGIFRLPPLCCWRLGLYERAKQVVLKAVWEGKSCSVVTLFSVNWLANFTIYDKSIPCKVADLGAFCHLHYISKILFCTVIYLWHNFTFYPLSSIGQLSTVCMLTYLTLTFVLWAGAISTCCWGGEIQMFLG